MTEKVTFQARDGKIAHAELAVPKGDADAPAVVLLHEWWGLNDHVRSLLKRLADAGFVAIAPDLYDGKVATDPEEASKLMNELKWYPALEVIAGAQSWVRDHPRCSGGVGVMGFCMGGAGTFVSAARLDGFRAAVPFYGIAPTDYVDWSGDKPSPIQAHFAQHDEWAKVADAEAVRDVLTKRGREMELFVYDAQHAFVNDTRPEVYHPENAKLAWGRAMEFLHKHLD